MIINLLVLLNWKCHVPGNFIHCQSNIFHWSMFRTVAFIFVMSSYYLGSIITAFFFSCLSIKPNTRSGGIYECPTIGKIISTCLTVFGASLSSHKERIAIIITFLFCPPQPSANNRTIFVVSLNWNFFNKSWTAEDIARVFWSICFQPKIRENMEGVLSFP